MPGIQGKSKSGRNSEKNSKYKMNGIRERNKKRKMATMKRHLEKAAKRRSQNHPNYVFEKRKARFEKNHKGETYIGLKYNKA